MSPGRPPLTTERRLGAGAVLRAGSTAPYRAVTIVDGEPHVVRDDFGAAGDGTDGAGRSGQAGRAMRAGRAGHPLLCLVHLTDLQLADVQSPTRFEFLNRHFADPRYAGIIPVQRPHEALTVHAVDATLRTVNALNGPATGAPLQPGGDHRGRHRQRTVERAADLPCPARRGARRAGLRRPRLRGGPGARLAGRLLLEAGRARHWRAPTSSGANSASRITRGCWSAPWPSSAPAACDLPWLSCFGNHEALNQGVGVPTAGIADALVGIRKPLALPEAHDHDRALELFTERPEAFLAGRPAPSPPTPGAAPITRRDFVEAHFRPGARPLGHGFSPQNRLDGTAYYVHDTPAVRLIALDTNCLAGGSAGCLDRQQARWLEGAAGRGALGLPRRRRARRQHRPRGPSGHRLLPSWDRHPDQRPAPGPGRGADARRGRRAGPRCTASPTSCCG